MDNPNLSFHVHQILSALRDVSNHLLYLPDQYRDAISTELSQFSEMCTEMVSDYDVHSASPSLSDEYTASDKAQDVSPFARSETVELFDSYIALNADGEFTYANPTAFTFFGRPEQDLKGKIIWEALPHLKEGPLYPIFQEAVNTRMPAHMEMQGINSRWFAINVHPTNRGVIIYWLDVTEKKRIEQALLASEERLRAAIETAPISVFTLDQNLRYVWVGSRRDGFFHEPVIGKRDDELLPAQDAAILLEVEQYVLDTGKGLRKEVQFEKNEHPVIYSMVIEPLFDGSEDAIGLTVAVMNVTEQRRLEAERQEYAARMELQRRLFRQSEKERIELARNLHDGPIQSMIGLGFSLQIIKDILKEDHMRGDENIQRMGEDLQSAISELRTICNELRPPVLTRLGLSRALQENIEDFKQAHPQIQITSDLSGHIMVVPDPIAIALYRIYQQALINIVRHAEANAVSVRLEVNHQQVLLEITDDGKGMAETIDWNAFARDGHLGLIGMKERADAVGGSFRLVSRPGEGTSVQVVVPFEAHGRYEETM